MAAKNDMRRAFSLGFRSQLWAERPIAHDKQWNAVVQAFPRADQSFQSFFARKPPHKKCVLSPSLSLARITGHKIRLDDDLLRRQSPPNKFLTRKFRESNVTVHHSGPGLQSAVDSEHEGN